MKILLTSDLHLNHREKASRARLLEQLFTESGDYDVCAIAGDLCDFKGGTVSWASAIRELLQYARKPVLFVPGNHDFAFSEARGALPHMLDLVEYQYQGRFYYLTSWRTCTIQGQRFVGFTNWYRLGHVRREDRDWFDFRHIPGHRRYIQGDAQRDADWAARTIQPDDVVITHMLPSESLISAEYTGHPWNRFFFSERHEIDIPKAWLFGHTHSHITGGSRNHCHSRPVGYPGNQLD